MRICLLLAMCAAVSVSAIARGPHPVPHVPKVFVDGEKGFDLYLTAALAEKQVPVTVVTERNMADYALEAVSDSQQRSGLDLALFHDWSLPLFPQGVHENEQASVRLVDLKTNEVVFAYSVHKNNVRSGPKSAAEACVKQLKTALQRKNGILAGSDSGLTKTAKVFGVARSHDRTFAF